MATSGRRMRRWHNKQNSHFFLANRAQIGLIWNDYSIIAHIEYCSTSVNKFYLVKLTWRRNIWSKHFQVREKGFLQMNTYQTRISIICIQNHFYKNRNEKKGAQILIQNELSKRYKWFVGDFFVCVCVCVSHSHKHYTSFKFSTWFASVYGRRRKINNRWKHNEKSRRSPPSPLSTLCLPFRPIESIKCNWTELIQFWFVLAILRLHYFWILHIFA